MIFGISLQWHHNEHDGISNPGVLILYSTAYSGTDQRKHQGSASLAFVRGIHRWPVNPPHKRPVMLKMFPFDDVIMCHVHKFTDTQSYATKCILLYPVIKMLIVLTGSYFSHLELIQAGKLALARSPMRVQIWPGEWKTGLGEWNFV